MIAHMTISTAGFSRTFQLPLVLHRMLDLNTVK